MGAQLVSLALTRWAPHTPDRAFRVLIRMALTALDEGTVQVPAGLYFGGRDLLLSCLRAERKGSRESVLRALSRAIDDLVKLGAVERVNKAYAGVNQVYKLTLMAAVRIDGRPVDNFGKGDTDNHPLGDTHDHPEGDTGATERVTPTTTPRNQEEPLEELREETSLDLRGPVTAPRANQPAHKLTNESPLATDPPPPPQCPEPTCARGYVLTADNRIEKCPRCNSNVIPFPERRSA